MLAMLLLIGVLCVDSFFASLSYGMSRIKIPLSSAAIISLVGTVLLSVSLFLAEVVSGLLPVEICRAVGVTLLLFLGINSIIISAVKNFLRRREGGRQLSFKYGGVDFVVGLYLDETVADLDNSKVLSIKEAFLLGAALSIDSLVTGFGVGLGIADKPLTAILTFIFGLLSVLLGQALGKKLVCGKSAALSYLSGAVLIILAVLRML